MGGGRKGHMQTAIEDIVFNRMINICKSGSGHRINYLTTTLDSHHIQVLTTAFETAVHCACNSVVITKHVGKKPTP